MFSDFYSPKGVHVVINDRGVLFGFDRSLSNTGLNGTSVNLDPPRRGSGPIAGFFQHGRTETAKAQGQRG